MSKEQKNPKILFVANFALSEDEIAVKGATKIWIDFENDANKLKLPASSAKKLSRNVWLLDSENTLPYLLELANLAKTHNILYQAYFLHDDLVEMTAKPQMKISKEAINHMKR